MPTRDSCTAVIQDAAYELGLATSTVGLETPLDDDAPTNAVVLAQYLKAVGRMLALKYSWSALEQAYTFATVASTASYVLPAGFARLIDKTVWDRTNIRQLTGPISPQQWEAVQAGATTAPDTTFALFGGLMYLTPTPRGIATIAYRYRTTYWLRADGTTEADAPTVDDPWELAAPNDGIPVLDNRLLIAGIKVAYLKDKGFPSQAAQDEYEDALSTARRSEGGGAPILELSGPTGPKLIDTSRLPDTGWGL